MVDKKFKSLMIVLLSLLVWVLWVWITFPNLLEWLSDSLWWHEGILPLIQEQWLRKLFTNCYSSLAWVNIEFTYLWLALLLLWASWILFVILWNKIGDVLKSLKALAIIYTLFFAIQAICSAIQNWFRDDSIIPLSLAIAFWILLWLITLHIYKEENIKKTFLKVYAEIISIRTVMYEDDNWKEYSYYVTLDDWKIIYQDVFFSTLDDINEWDKVAIYLSPKIFWEFKIDFNDHYEWDELLINIPENKATHSNIDSEWFFSQLNEWNARRIILWTGRNHHWFLRVLWAFWWVIVFVVLLIVSLMIPRGKYVFICWFPLLAFLMYYCFNSNKRLHSADTLNEIEYDWIKKECEIVAIEKSWDCEYVIIATDWSKIYKTGKVRLWAVDQCMRIGDSINVYINNDNVEEYKIDIYNVIPNKDSDFTLPKRKKDFKSNPELDIEINQDRITYEEKKKSEILSKYNESIKNEVKQESRKVKEDYTKQQTLPWVAVAIVIWYFIIDMLLSGDDFNIGYIIVWIAVILIFSYLSFSVHQWNIKSKIILAYWVWEKEAVTIKKIISCIRIPNHVVKDDWSWERRLDSICILVLQTKDNETKRIVRLLPTPLKYTPWEQCMMYKAADGKRYVDTSKLE